METYEKDGENLKISKPQEEKISPANLKWALEAAKADLKRYDERVAIDRQVKLDKIELAETRIQAALDAGLEVPE